MTCAWPRPFRSLANDRSRRLGRRPRSDGDRLYTTYNRDIYASENQGATWARVSPLNVSYTDMVFFEGVALLQEEEAIFQSPDFGETAVRAVEGIGRKSKSRSKREWAVKVSEIVLYSILRLLWPCQKTEPLF